jgi:hypothetical protein
MRRAGEVRGKGDVQRAASGLSKIREDAGHSLPRRGNWHPGEDAGVALVRPVEFELYGDSSQSGRALLRPGKGLSALQR